MPERPTIPPIDQSLLDEAKRLNDESTATLQQVAGLAFRVGQVMAQMDELRHDQPNEVEEFLRHVTGYDDLMNTWHVLAGHATAAADEPGTTLPEPAWYGQLLEGRRARWERVA